MIEPWGKFDGGTGDTHHLAHHCADVAAVFRELANLPEIRSRMEKAAAGKPLSNTVIERLCVLVFLHDVGKLHPGFQIKGWPGKQWSIHPCGHVREGLEIFLASGNKPRPAAQALQLEALCEWGVTPGLLRSVISHHGKPAPNIKSQETVNAGWRNVGDYDPDAAAKAIGIMIPDWFPEAFTLEQEPLPDNSVFEHLLCGLTSLADWIGSDRRHFPFVAELDRYYAAKARERAQNALHTIQINPQQQRDVRSEPATFHAVTGFEHPNPQQKVVGNTDLEAQLVILEAETGSGKTEAALWRYAQLFEAGKVSGLYFAVPTRAAAVQLHNRVVGSMERLFGNASPEAVLAVPGYLKAGDHEGVALPDWKVLWDDEPDAEQLARRWAAENSKRYLAAQVAVGTIDQAMLGGLKVKHAHLRAASLSRSLLVIDEVHASDSFMTEIQKNLLDAHLQLGGYAMLMSATLGSPARVKWLGQEQPSFSQAVKEPYPVVWTNSQDAPSEVQKNQKEKLVQMSLVQTMAPEATARKALKAAHQNARVLVIRNTVARAIETLEALEAMVPENAGLIFNVDGIPTLHHSRFSPSDRRILDQAVEAALSTDKERKTRGLIVIGTQTLEQSLDIDADILITDLCPIDVLLQRIGRLHRHTLARPDGFDIPRCLVMTPEQGLEPLLTPKFDNGLGAWESRGALEGVYSEVPILKLTQRLIAEHEEWLIPDMNRLLVESATHPERIGALLDELGEKWRDYHMKLRGGDFAEKSGARLIALDRRQPFEDLSFPDAEERIRTRLGEEGVRLKLPAPVRGPFSELFQELVLPAHMSHGINPEDPVAIARQDTGPLEITVSGAAFVYDRFGIRRLKDNA